MIHVLIMVDKTGACSEVPASWHVVPGTEMFHSYAVESKPGFIVEYRPRCWYLMGQIAGLSRLKSAPVDSRRLSLRALVFPGDKRLLENATDELLDRIVEHDTVMIYEEQ